MTPDVLLEVSANNACLCLIVHLSRVQAWKVYVTAVVHGQSLNLAEDASSYFAVLPHPCGNYSVIQVHHSAVILPTPHQHVFSAHVPARTVLQSRVHCTSSKRG